MAKARMRSAYLEFEGRFLRFIVENEQAEHTSTVVDHAVEQGANVADHVRTDPDRVTLQVVISNTPVADLNGYGRTVKGLELQVPKAKKTIAPTPGALMNAAFDAIGGFFSPPEEWKAIVATWPAGTDPVRAELATLLDWKNRAVVGTVHMPWDEGASEVYTNMVITSVNPSRTSTTGDAVELSLGFQKVRIVEVTSAVLPLPDIPTAKHLENKGRQPPTEIEGPKKSTAKFLADKARGR